MDITVLIESYRTTNSTLIISHDHPLLVLSQGSICPGSDKMRASSMYRFICDPSVFSAGTPKLVAQLPIEDDQSCAFVFEWRTHVSDNRELFTLTDLGWRSLLVLRR